MPDTDRLSAKTLDQDSTRLPTDPASLAARNAVRIRGRKNFAAMLCEDHGVPTKPHESPFSVAEKNAATDFRELGAMLGLHEEDGAHPAGYCTICGGPIPISAHGHPGRYRPGKCYSCSNNVDTADRRPSPATPEPTTTGHRPRYEGHCPDCGRGYHLTGTGRLRPHLGWARRNGVDRRLRTNCPGSGELAREWADTAHLVEAGAR